MIGTCDHEMGNLLPGFLQLGNPNIPRDTLIGQLSMFIGKSDSSMSKDDINHAATHAMEVMEDIYGAQNSKCPLKPEDQDYSRYCFLKSMADQWFMGPYLRAEENCESRHGPTTIN